MGAGEAASAVRAVSLGRSGLLHPDFDFLKLGVLIPPLPASLGESPTSVLGVEVRPSQARNGLQHFIVGLFPPVVPDCACHVVGKVVPVVEKDVNG